MDANIKKFNVTDYVSMNEKAIEILSSMSICINREFSNLFNKNKMSFFIFLLMKYRQDNGLNLSLLEMSDDYGISINTLWKASKFLSKNDLIFKYSKKSFGINENVKFATYGENYIKINNKAKWNLLFAGNFNTLWVLQILTIKANASSNRDLANAEIPNKAFRKLKLNDVTIHNQLKLISKVLLELDFNDVFSVEKGDYQLEDLKFETYTEEEIQDKLIQDENFKPKKQLCMKCCDLRYSLSKQNQENDWKHFRKNGRCYFYCKRDKKYFWKSHK
ncbi:MAGa4850 family ICE element protein, partial [Mycoplasma sp. VS31B]